MAMKMFGVWHRYTWQDYYNNVKYFSLGMISLGLKRGDVACIIGDNEPQWFVLLHKEFDPDEAELTRTRKLRREFMSNAIKT